MDTLRLSELQTLRRRRAWHASPPGVRGAILDKHLEVKGTDPIHSGAWGSSPIEAYFHDRLARDEKGEKAP